MIHRTLIACASCLMLCASIAAESPPIVAIERPEPVASGEDAEAAAKKWLEGLDDMKGLVIDQTIKQGGFKGQPISGTTSYMYVLNQDGWWITLGFAGKIEADTPLADVKKQFKYIALDRVPTPGLDVPGWDVKPRTPVSSFKDGVEFVGLKDGKLSLKVKTRFFALYGRNPNVLVPADAPSPKGSYFQIRQNIPFDLSLTAPLSVK